MRKTILLFLCMLFASMAHAQTGTIALSVTSTPLPIVVNANCNYVVIQENAASPSNAFTITLPGGSTAINYPSGTKFVFSSAPNGFNSGQTIGSIAVASGTISFVGIESTVAPTVPQNPVTNGGLSGQTTNYLPKATSATASTVSSSVSDNGTDVITAEPFQALYVALGTGNAQLACGTTACMIGGETTCSNITPSASNDYFCPDGTAHRWLVSENGAAAHIAFVLVASLTTTSASSDTVAITDMTSSGHCSVTATNATASASIATVYVSNKTTNQITVTHGTTANMTFDILCTAY
jgi:hypothetical protein